MTPVTELPHNLKGFALTSPIKQWFVLEVIAPFSHEYCEITSVLQMRVLLLLL